MSTLEVIKDKIEYYENKYDDTDNTAYERIMHFYQEKYQAKLQTIWETALEKFPHELDSTGCTQGNMPEDTEYGDEIEYSKEYTFSAGKLFNLNFIAGGWIEFRLDSWDDTPYITGGFSIAKNGNFHDKESQLLGDYKMAQTWYNLDSESWDDIVIDTY